jgi:LysR family transcriptional regulator, glycine cleavage system transcriptional activator
MRRLPPLSTLPVLESAARLQSFSAAAEELHVTHGAVSHQIKSLEESLGVALFARTGRRVVLTAEGAVFAEAVRTALAGISEAIEQLSPSGRERKLKISVLPSFASRWLMPRLGRFLEANPHYEISVEATPLKANFIADGVDIAIRFGRGPWPGVHTERIAGDSYFPVCSPKFRLGKLPTKPAHLAELPLFHLDPGRWEKWFAAAGLPDICPKFSGIDYNDAALFLQQAINGEGIALTRRSLIGDDLCNGKLVKLFDIEVDTEEGYYLVCLPQHANGHKVRTFRDWIVKQIDWVQK